jgi:tRNA wybutosine-synthesizing protein 3|tara:strand:+ start:1248 stop:2132 length:885 start_codon:yes stop_codon:yes gene_type:complete
MHRHEPHHRLRELVGEFLKNRGGDSNLLDTLPKHWEKFDNTAILQRGSFGHNNWKEHLGKDLWRVVAEALLVERLARMGEIVGGKRESTVELLLGDDDWVVRKENKVDYGYRFTECMFSAGNINERKRMGDVGESGEIVVDLFCGIGYYTLPMLVHSDIEHIHCCEWNPNAISSLEWNLERNKVKKRCSIHPGDNRVTTSKLLGIADRVILGLLPSAEGGYEIALKCLKSSGGILHIHGVANSKNHDLWIKETIDFITSIDPSKEIREVNKVRVKSYAPHWDHLVIDLEIKSCT